MGRWGMGIAQSDEFADVVDKYFGLYYYTAEPLAQIEAEILHNYEKVYADFEAYHGVWHDVFFALAECGWKCGYNSKDLMEKVEKIIKNGLDLDYLKSLGASQRDLTLRTKVLDKFLAKIKSENAKPMQRKMRKPFINPFRTGDVFAYKYKGAYYGGVVLQGRDKSENEPIYRKTYNYCIVVAQLKSSGLPTTDEIINAEIRFAEWLTDSGLPKNGFIIIENIADQISKNYIGYLCTYANNISDFCIYGNAYDVSFLHILSPEFDGGNHMEIYKMSGKQVKYLFDTDNMLKTQQVSNLPRD